ncbi:MAG: CDP-alcohol phosphatidyltransferase family protein [Thermoplasmatota archaeon]
MTGDYDRLFGREAKWLLAHGVHPNHFTFLQLPVFAFQVTAVVEGTQPPGPHAWAWRVAFVTSIALVILLDGGDGILARVGGLESRSGAVLDSLFDTFGIAIVLWGAAQFEPVATNWLTLLFVGNLLLFLQNALLDHKLIAFVRGPVLASLLVPDTLFAGLLVPSVVLLFLMAVRLKATAKALAHPLHLP